MSRGQRSSASNANAAAGTSSQQQQNPQQQTPRRSNKTLGWYLSDKLAAPASNGVAEEPERDRDRTDSSTSQMPPNRQSQPRKGSLVETNSGGSSRASPKIAEQQLKSHMKRNVQQQQQSQGNHRPRANSSALASKKSNSSVSTSQSGQTGFNSNSPKDLLPNQQQSDRQGTPQLQQRIGKGISTKEDYWYYDEVSDGFYYEHNGTRGWRKRKEEWGTVEQMKTESSKKFDVAQQKKLVDPKASVPSLLAPPQQLNKFMQPGALTSNELFPPPPTAPVNVKYYDPTTDGYYYEMASFDGWKRRQPTAAGGEGGVSPPSSLSSSLGANQQKGQFMQQKFQQQHQRQSSSPATATSAVGPVPHRKIQPLHYQAYQQPAPQLNPLELQEMILLAQRQHLRSAANSQPQQQCYCSQQPDCCPSTAPCYCTIAAMAAQLVLKQQQMTQQDAGREMTDSKSMDNIRSLLDRKLLKQPTKLFPSYEVGQPKTEALMKTPTSKTQPLPTTNLKLPRNKWNPLGIVPTMAKSLSEEKTATTTTLSSGSFEEPYEFYWSGDEAGSEAPSNNNNTLPNNHQLNARNNEIMFSNNNTAASVSSMDDDGMEELMFGSGMMEEKKPQIAPIGSETFAASNNYNVRTKTDLNNGKKRPDTLKLTCPKPMSMSDNQRYEPISPGEIIFNGSTSMNGDGGTAGRDGVESPAVSYLPYQFNVDKFIADLPMPSFDAHERMLLHSLRSNPNNSLRTPLVATNTTFPVNAEPSTAESPLFTPIVLGRDPWAHHRRQAEENPWTYP